ncbi:MAG: FAD-dependent oxidoreductase [Betaproteobacteria bacterium]
MTEPTTNSSSLTPHSSLNADVLIIGAGPVGMTLALALADSPLRVLLVDSQPRGNWRQDPRALALAHGSRQVLERLGAWNAAAGTAIEDIHISQKSGFGSSMIDAKDYGIPALGYVMSYSKLAAALDAQLNTEQLLAPCFVERIETSPDKATITLTHDGQTRQITAQLVVHAEGAADNDPALKVRPYGQHAIVADVRLKSAPHPHRAWERFTPDGPVALLPHGEGYSVVFTVPSAKAEAILELDDEAFLATLRAQFGTRLDFSDAGPRASFPLALRVRSPLSQHRQVWIGNAAQTLHPVSGQGFNLGLRDAWELAEILHAHSNDAGDAAGLATYARSRQLDRHASMAFTDGIVSLFSNDSPPLKLARGLGLLALDLCPPLRHFVAKRLIWGARAWP